LRDRHIEATVDDCNVDLGRVKLRQMDNGESAQKIYQRLSLQYEAQLARATALSITRTGAHGASVPEFEKALALADKAYAPDSPRLMTYLTGLANSYIRTGRYEDFNRLYSSRMNSIHDDAVKAIFSHHQIRSLLQTGRAALGREDYRTALYNFRQALKIDYKNRDAIAATMSALVRSGQHDEAITFLEETEQKLDSEPDRKDVREAIALVAYQKARKDHKEGRTVEAERSLRKAIKLDPGTATYLVLLARWTHKAGKYAEADALLRRGLDTFKDEPRRQELIEARDKLRQTEMILAKIRRAGA
jgi:tetratricopeptide (TPR) repeat protein